MAPVDYAPDKLVTSIIFHIHLYLQVSGCGLPCEINYLMGPRIVIIFSLFSIFIAGSIEVMASNFYMSQLKPEADHSLLIERIEVSELHKKFIFFSKKFLSGVLKTYLGYTKSEYTIFFVILQSWYV